MSEIPTPGGEVAGWRQYAPRVDGSNQMIGFTDPDGKDVYDVKVRWDDESTVLDELYFDLKGKFLRKKQ